LRTPGYDSRLGLPGSTSDDAESSARSEITTLWPCLVVSPLAAARSSSRLHLETFAELNETPKYLACPASLAVNKSHKDLSLRLCLFSFIHTFTLAIFDRMRFWLVFSLTVTFPLRDRARKNEKPRKSKVPWRMPLLKARLLTILSSKLLPGKPNDRYSGHPKIRTAQQAARSDRAR
jgi:hypothetical protein